MFASDSVYESEPATPAAVTELMRMNRLILFAFGACALMTTPAFAHHAMEGKTPVTWMQGLISGLAHPVLGLDHLAALVAVGLLASRFANGYLITPFAWLVGMALGAYAHMRGVDLPGGELLVAASVIVIGLVGALRPTLPIAGALLLFAIAGAAHGHALAESIIGAEAAPLGAYFAGLILIQGAIVAGVASLARRIFPPVNAPAIPVRAASAAAAGVGAVFLTLALPALA